MTARSEKIHKVWQYVCRKIRNVGDFYQISAAETGYIALMFIIMLGINYTLIAMNGFSLSYSKQWPEISCVSEVFWLLFLLLGGHFICRRNRWYLWSIMTLQFLCLFVLLSIYFTTGTFFCESVLYLVYDTTWEETKGFFSAYVSLKSVIIMVMIAAVYGVISYFMMKLYKPEKKYCRGDLRILISILIILIFPSVKTVMGGKWNVIGELLATHPLNAIYNHIRIFNSHTREFIIEMRHRTPPDYVTVNPALENNPPVGVLVIGESAIRSHHSLYGYHRNTTPNLLKRKDSIIAFDDTIAVLPMTIIALKYWLTDITLEHRHVKWTIFDALKVAGYKVDVMTNQNKSGWADSPLQMIFKTADSVTYMHDENYSDLHEDLNAGIYDRLLLPPFNTWAEKTSQYSVPQLAVVHLFGSHEPYASRYPADFSREFLDDSRYPQLVNEYDTSILYSDMILGKMIEQMEKMDRPAFLIYISDHGSVCDSDELRTPRSKNNSAYEIPFFIWTNRKYRELLPQTVQRMQKHCSVPLQADRAHFGLLEMMGIAFTRDVEPQNFLSDKFIVRPRTLQEGEIPYVKEGKK